MAFHVSDAGLDAVRKSTRVARRLAHGTNRKASIDAAAAHDRVLDKGLDELSKPDGQFGFPIIGGTAAQFWLPWLVRYSCSLPASHAVGRVRVRHQREQDRVSTCIVESRRLDEIDQ